MLYKKANQYMMLICFGILVLFTSMITIRFITNQIFVKKLHMDNRIVRTILFDREDFFKKKEENKEKIKFFAEEKYPINEINKGQSILSKIDGFIENKLRKKVNDWAQRDGIAYYDKFVEFGRQYEMLLGGWNLSRYGGGDKAVNMSDGYLIFPQLRINQQENIQAINELKKICNESGSDLLYLMLPNKINKYGDEHLNNIVDFSNANTDEFILGLRESNIDFIDMREKFKGDDEYVHSLFFKTDHHWKPETAIEASEILARTLNDRYNFNLELWHFSKNNFHKDVYENCFLGSQGKKVTLVKTTLDDISVIYPNEDINMKYTNFGWNRQETVGDYSIIYNMNNFNNKNYYISNQYSIYDRGSWNIINDKAVCTKKILFIGDSFGEAMAPIFSLACKDITYFRAGEQFSIKDYILGEKPDIVIFACFPGSSVDKKISYKSLHESHFDFR